MDPRTSNLSQQQHKNLQKIFFQEKIWEKIFLRKILKYFFQLQVTIPSADPVKISSRSDNYITLA